MSAFWKAIWIIAGRVYHGDMLPYELPATKALAVVESDTYKGRGCNEMVR